jgi:uncharacterized membrane protein (UPF0136 family)
MMYLKILAAIAYGLMAILGGVMGYLKAKSKVSLISGIISGLLLLLSGFMLWQKVAITQVLSQVVTAILVIVFIIRLVKTRKLFPAGLMVAAGVITLIIISA